MKRILLAEDNNNLRELITDYLSANEIEVDPCKDGDMAWEHFQTGQYDLVLLDIMMPGMDGFELCKKIRGQETVPILFITAKVQEEDQLYGYEIGADDYIVKPFSLPVLLAKCKVIFARHQKGNEFIQSGEVRVYTKQRRVIAGDVSVTLQALDYELLLYLMRNPGVVMSREQILLKIWGYDYEGTDRAVDTHVKNLRKALGEYGRYIRTVIKSGYVWDVE